MDILEINKRNKSGLNDTEIVFLRNVQLLSFLQLIVAENKKLKKLM